jgi:hypothetical protein
VKRTFYVVLIVGIAGCGRTAGQEVPQTEEKPAARYILRHELRYAPPNATGIVSVNVEQLLRSKFFEKLPAGDRKTLIEVLRQECGLAPADVARYHLFGTEGGALRLLTSRTDLSGEQILDRIREEERKRPPMLVFKEIPLNSADPAARGEQKTAKTPKDEWKSSAVGKYQLFEKAIRRGGVFDTYEAYCVPEPRVVLADARGGRDVSRELLRHVLEVDREPSLSDGLKAALHSAADLKTLFVAYSLRDSAKARAELLADPTGDLKRIATGVDWVAFETELNDAGAFAGRARFACGAGETPAGLRKHLEGLLAKVVQQASAKWQHGAATDRAVAQRFVKDFQRSLTWKEEGRSLVVDFRADARGLYDVICSLGRSAQSTFESVGTTVGSAVGEKK